MSSRFTLFNDPVHGFVSVPKGLVMSLVETPEVQRLRRIRQLGLGFLVFPGAVHTRFEHGLGAMALMQDALATLREKGTFMDTDEVTGALAAALLHDVGHGPFSHTLEDDLVAPGPSGTPYHHERMSRAIMARLNDRFGGQLDVALKIFDGTYDRPFFHSLLSSQLDMDRLDYLRRDSFYTGVAEGVVGVDRILKTMRVHPRPGGADSRVVIEAKGAYAVENVLLSRRLMYWQVYLHKTVIAGDHGLRAVFQRARQRPEAFELASPPLAFILSNETTADDLDPDAPGHEALLDAFCQLDDVDVLSTLKQWMRSPDRVLADLSRRFLDRDLFRTAYLDAPPTEADLSSWRETCAEWLIAEGLSDSAHALSDAALYVTPGQSRQRSYRPTSGGIAILERDGRLRELSRASDLAAVDALARPVEKDYVCLPKQLDIDL
ncbi:MAG: HD domain-containing protein [Rubricoccaceae bacterium]